MLADMERLVEERINGRMLLEVVQQFFRGIRYHRGVPSRHGFTSGFYGGKAFLPSSYSPERTEKVGSRENDGQRQDYELFGRHVYPPTSPAVDKNVFLYIYRCADVYASSIQ
jgi:hypothetical protein